MKKFTKLLAVLLAIAVIVCPMVSALSVSADATPSGTYKLEQVDGDTVRLTISSTDGFVVYKAVINCDNPISESDIRLEGYTLKEKAQDGYNLPAIGAKTVGNNTTILVSASDAGTLDLYTEVVIDIDVTTGSDVKITNIQAADQGAIEDDPTLLAFPAVADASVGDINTEAGDYPEADAELENVHTHVATTTVAAAAATCSATGTYGYVYCGICEKYFINDTFATETTVAAREIPIDPNAHNYGEYVSDGNATCTADGTKTRTCANDPAHKDTVADTGSMLPHSFTTKDSGVEVTAATCTAAAVHKVQCDNCAAISDTVTVSVGDPAGHNMTSHAANAETCVADGNSAYWSCDRCNKFFSDALGNTEIAEDSWVIPSTGHKASDTKTYEKTPATCKDDAVYYQECSVCHDQLASTWTDTDSHLSVAHTYGEYVYNNDATCTVNGTKTATCSVCETATDTVADPAHPMTGHNWDYTSNENGTHNATCLNGCGATITDEDCDHAGANDTCSKCEYVWHVHAYTDHFEVVTQPTKDAKGSKKSYCSCGEFITEEIAKTTAAPAGAYVTDTNLVVTELVAVKYGISKKNILATGADSYKVVFDYEGYDNYNIVPKQTVIDWNEHTSANASDNKRFYTFKDIPLYSLGSNYTITVYFYKDGVAVNHYLVPETNIIAITNADCAANISNSRVVKAYADMIQYASEAQAYFANQYKDKDIATAALPTESFNYTSYATAPGDASIPYRAVNSGAVVAAGSQFAAFEPSVMLDTSNQFKFVIKFPSPNTNDASKLLVRIHYTNGYGTAVSKDYTAANGLTLMDTTSSRTRYSVTFDSLALYDLEKTVYCDVIYDGVKQYTYSYTLGNYVNTQAGATSGMEYVVKAMGVFYESAKDCLFPTGNYIAD